MCWIFTRDFVLHQLLRLELDFRNPTQQEEKNNKLNQRPISGVRIPEVIVKPALVFREKICDSEIRIKGENVGEILQGFLSMFENELKELRAISGDRPKLHPSIIVLLNGRDVRFLQGEKTKVNHNDVLMIIPPIAGG